MLKIGRHDAIDRDRSAKQNTKRVSRQREHNERLNSNDQKERADSGQQKGRLKNERNDGTQTADSVARQG